MEKKSKPKKIESQRALHDKVYSISNPKNFAKLDSMSSPYLLYHCKCGHDGHVIGRGFDFYECGACGKKYILNLFMETTEVTKDMLAFLENTGRATFLKGK